MKVAALIHFYLPWRCAGSEVVAAELLEAAVAAGHDVTVYCTHSTADRNWTGHEPDTMWGGVKVTRHKNVILAGQAMMRDKPDVVVSHHQHVMYAVRKARTIKARSVFLVHNPLDLNRRPLAMRPDLVVFNSDHVRETLAKFGTPRQSMTFHPPITPDRHRTESTGDAITLVNLNADKGAELFYALAKAEPGRRFLGVVGAHGVQIVRRNLPNVTIMEHTPDMRKVWASTRVLLMPSFVESYGLVAQEAGLNGIPTIAHPTPGLVENLGPGGMFADRDDVTEWRLMLSRLDRPDDYYRASLYALNRADEAMRQTSDTLKMWVEWLG